MSWMNAWEIDEAVDLLRHKPIYGPAAIFLQEFKDIMDCNSDGWPYVMRFTKCSDDLQAIVQEGVHLIRPWGAYRDTKATKTEADVKRSAAKIIRAMKNHKQLSHLTPPELNLAVEQQLL